MARESCWKAVLFGSLPDDENPWRRSTYPDTH
jgi:hypothetical protein